MSRCSVPQLCSDASPFLTIATEEEVQIHFDGWGEEYDFRCRHDAVELHPVGWCEDHDWELQTPLSRRHVSLAWLDPLLRILFGGH